MKEYFETDAKFLKLDIPFPYEEMLKEAVALREHFVTHRDGEAEGWMGLTLHGLDSSKTGTWQDYGYNTAADAGRDMSWTDIADQCPITKSFFLNNFPSKQYGRVRFMLVEAGGYISMHNDSKSGIRLTENINMPLSNPKGCIWKWGDGTKDLFMEPGVVYAMNISYDHAVYNNSDQDRYHIIVARHDSTKEWKSLITKAASEQNVTGRFITINDLP